MGNVNGVLLIYIYNKTVFRITASMISISQMLKLPQTLAKALKYIQ